MIFLLATTIDRLHMARYAHLLSKTKKLMVSFDRKTKLKETWFVVDLNNQTPHSIYMENCSYYPKISDETRRATIPRPRVYEPYYYKRCSVLDK